MKKKLIYIFCILLILCLVSCEKKNTETMSATEFKEEQVDISETAETEENSEIAENTDIENMVLVSDIASEYQVNESEIGILFNVLGCPYFDISGFPKTEEGENFYRLNLKDRWTYPKDIRSLAEKSSGGKIRFKTNAEKISITLNISTLSDFGYMSRMGSNGIDIYYGEGRNKTYLTSCLPTSRLYTADVDLPEGTNEYTVLLPVYASVDYVEIGLPRDSYIGEPKPYTVEKPIVFLGGGDTQGVSSSRPGLAYTELVSRKFDANIVNLGFDSENYGDYSLARYISSLDMSVLVMNYDSNANSEEFADNLYMFYKLIRDAKPDLPIVFMTKCGFEKNETANETEKRNQIKSNYENALKDGDKNIYFIDGQSIFPDEYGDLCNAGNNTTNDLGMFYISEKLCEILSTILK